MHNAEAFERPLKSNNLYITFYYYYYLHISFTKVALLMNPLWHRILKSVQCAHYYKVLILYL